MRATILLALALTACASPGYAPPPDKPLRTYAARTDADNPPKVLGLPLKTGQIVLTEAPGDYSFIFNIIPSEFHRFTHAAILVFEDGEPYVYDIVGQVSTFQALFADRPTDALYGQVRRNRFYDYVRPNVYTEIYDPPEGVDPAKVAAYVQQAHKDEVPFDPYFNHKTTDKIYCAQLVALALEAGGAEPMTLTKNTDNPSMRAVLEWLNVSDNGALPAGRFADPKRFRGAAGTFGSPIAVTAYYAAKQVIYERFTRDQKLGNIFRLDGFEIFLREEVDAFVRAAIKTVLTKVASKDLLPEDEAVLAEVRRVADEKLGAFRPDGAQGS